MIDVVLSWFSADLRQEEKEETDQVETVNLDRDISYDIEKASISLPTAYMGGHIFRNMVQGWKSEPGKRDKRLIQNLEV